MARSTRGAIGEHWWSQRFLAVLESFALGSRLTRGRAYARQGQVVSLEVARGEVRSSVQGSRRTPYEVVIGLAPFTELVWAKVEVALVEQAIYSARLLAGEMPEELEGVFVEAGAPLFPRRVDELTLRCSCPDRQVPCKHLAATFYLLAERFDADPFQILAWRGRERSRLLDRLRALRGEPAPDPGLGSDLPEDLPSVGAAIAMSDLVMPAVPPIEADPHRFWAAVPLAALPSTTPLPADLLLRQLPTPPGLLGGSELVGSLRLLYLRMGGDAE